jgi:hypothetical protein
LTILKPPVGDTFFFCSETSFLIALLFMLKEVISSGLIGPFFF